MTTNDALRAAIRATPGDDLPRLAFADWCDEHDDPDRAAFIRAELTLARMAENAPGRSTLEDQADDLLAAHRDEWLGPAGAQASRWNFHRGFAESCSIEVGRLADCAAELFQRHPLRRLRVHQSDGAHLDDAGVGALVACEQLRDLDSLTLFVDADSLGPDAVAALAECPHLGNLRELDLGANDPGQGIGPAGVRSLAHSRHLGRLTRLNLRWQAVGDEGASILAASPLLPRLERLDLGAIQGVQDAGLVDLFSSPGARSLKWVNLEHSNPGRSAAECILDWADRARPAGLHLGSLPPEVHGRLASAGWLPGLTEIGLTRLPEGLFRAAPLTSVLCQGDSFLRRLREVSHLPSLRCLDLSHTGLDVFDLAHLLRGDHLAGLCSISFYHHSLGEEGAAVLADAPGTARLRHLNLRFSDTPAGGVRRLASSPLAAGLRSLYLSGLDLGAAGVRALCSSAPLAGLRELDLSGVEATDASVKLLGRSFRHLRWLDLSSSAALTDASARALCRANWPLLERLTLCHLGLGEDARDQLRKRWGPRVEFAAQDEWR